MTTPTPASLLPAALLLREAAQEATTTDHTEGAAERLLDSVVRLRPTIGEMLESIDTVREQLDEIAHTLLVTYTDAPRNLGLIHPDQQVELATFARTMQNYRLRLADRDATTRLEVTFEAAYSACQNLVNEAYYDGTVTSAEGIQALWRTAIEAVLVLADTLQQTPILKD